VTIGWRIGHTPRPETADQEHALWVEECDIYAIILGQDFSAPMGDELRKALNKGIRPLAYHKRLTPSPSALNTLHHVPLEWYRFTAPQQFRSRFTRDLLRSLIDQAKELGLNLGDLAGMMHLLEPEKAAPPPVTDPKLGDAGQGGVILGREVLED
jgi:hypothetical protein